MSTKFKKEDLNQLIERKRELESKLVHIERQLFTLEAKYLESTGGKLIADAEHYIQAATAPPHQQKALKKKQRAVAAEDRIFSLSSVTAFEANNKPDPGEYVAIEPERGASVSDAAYSTSVVANRSHPSSRSQIGKRGRPPGSKSSKNKVRHDIATV